ncbi:MAG: hypothetical protein PHS57_04640 [Alphaproteobacteria bacterium]|nr:hypothetical protein [Alphaproteobacteria bacterium]
MTTMNSLKRLWGDPGPSFALADVFLFAQIPSLYVAVPAVLLAGYVFARAAMGERGDAAFARIEKPISRAFFKSRSFIPFVNRIPEDAFNKDRPGAATLTVGMVQAPIFLGSLGLAVLNPGSAVGWMAAAATAFFAGSNIKAGLQMNAPETVQAEKTWREVATSTQVLDAAGLCCSGLLAGLATSFGLFVTVPVVAALGSAALVAAGKVGKVRLNTGVPMGVLTGCAVLNTAVGVLNGHWLAAVSNGASINGEALLTKFYGETYRDSRPQTETKGWREKASQALFFREEPMVVPVCEKTVKPVFSAHEPQPTVAQEPTPTSIKSKPAPQLYAYEKPSRPTGCSSWTDNAPKNQKK